MLTRKRLAGALALLLGVGTLPGCALLFTSKVKLKRDFRLTDPLNKKSPRDRFYSFRGKKKALPDCLAAFDPARCPFGSAVAPRPLIPPFQIGVSAGLFEPQRIAESQDALFCLEVDDVGEPTPPFGTVFWFLCARYTAGGTQVFAGDSAGAIDSATSQVFYPGVTEVDLEIEHDGVDWLLRTRERGGVGTDLLAQVAATAKQGDLLPSLGVKNLFKKGTVGFDDFSVASSDPPAPTDEEVFEGHLFDAIDLEYAACDAVDGPAPDFALAEMHLDDALLSLGQARAQLALLGDSKELRKAGKRLDQSEKTAQSALKKLAKLRVDPVAKKIEKTIKKQTDALLRVRPRSLDF